MGVIHEAVYPFLKVLSKTKSLPSVRCEGDVEASVEPDNSENYVLKTHFITYEALSLPRIFQIFPFLDILVRKLSNIYREFIDGTRMKQMH